MNTKVYDRKAKKIINEKSPSGANFLYNKKFGRIILKLVNKRFISSIAGFYMNRKISTIHINNFIKDNKIDMSDYESIKYKSFNQFFSRKIKNGKRKFDMNKDIFVSPCDSKLIVYKIDNNKEFIIKEKKYTIESILRDKKLALEYKNGYFMVFRLSVDDYHRYAYIDDGVVLYEKNIKGIYNTVGPIAFNHFKVYEENHRHYQVMDTANFGKIIQMEVGALLVGKIVNNNKKEFKKSEEKGYFLFGGSTIVVMVKENTIKIDDDILSNSLKNIETKVKQGEKIAKKIK